MSSLLKKVYFPLVFWSYMCNTLNKYITKKLLWKVESIALNYIKVASNYTVCINSLWLWLYLVVWMVFPITVGVITIGELW